MATWAPIPLVYSPPIGVPGVLCIKVPVTTPDRMRIVIGRDGKVFKSITYESRAHYIWYDHEAGCIEVWGRFRSAWDAASRVHARMELVSRMPEIVTSVVDKLLLTPPSESAAATDLISTIVFGDVPDVLT